MPDATRDGRTALLSDPGDVDAYAANLRRMMTDRALRAQFSDAAREFVQTERGIDSAAQTLRAVFAELGLA